MSRKADENTSSTRPSAVLADAGRRSLGLVLLALVVFPAFRVLDTTDLMDRSMAASGASNWSYVWGLALGWRTAVAVGAAVVLAFFTRGRIVTAISSAGERLAAISTRIAAGFVAVFGAALTGLVVFRVFDQRTILNDASVQLIQARYFAEGMLSGPPLVLPEFWSIQFMIQSAVGWVSQYPPGHSALLAGGYFLGAPWITMVVAAAVTGAALVLAFDRLFPEHRAMGRVVALLSVSSPFFLGLSGSYMNHATLAAVAALALYVALRAEVGSFGWAVAAGGLVGLMVTIRPVSGLILGILLTAVVWLTGPGVDLRDPDQRPALIRRLGAWVAGGVPFAIGFGLFNARFFGGPLTLGYVAASGPNHGLGFHEDPWGRMYTPTAAIGHSSSELLSLSRELFAAPIPLVALVGVFLLMAPRLSRGQRLVVAWALLPLLASALYWHHDLVFGPRMLGEAVPAWVALAVMTAVWLVGWVRGAEEAPSRLRLAGGDAISTLCVMTLVFGAAFGGPERLGMRGATLGTYPDVDQDTPSLVFIHEAWADRLGGRLAGMGLRLDSVRTLLTRYHPCQLEAGLMNVPQNEAMGACQREDASDAVVRTLGGLGLTGLLWLDDLPGLPAEGVLWVRDLGPERNRQVIEAHADRVPLFALPTARGVWEVVPYDQGVTTYWPPPPDPSEPEGA